MWTVLSVVIFLLLLYLIVKLEVSNRLTTHLGCLARQNFPQVLSTFKIFDTTNICLDQQQVKQRKYLSVLFISWGSTNHTHWAFLLFKAKKHNSFASTWTFKNQMTMLNDIENHVKA